MKFYLIAGEASGDLHAANLIKALKKKHPQAEFRCWGGDLMATAGATLVKHYRELAFMGFAEVLLNLRTILRNLSSCKADIAAYQPDAVIFVDYPGFNLRLAPFVKSLGIKTIYYISPQLWAWKAGRVKIIRAHIDQMLCILPFETDWYAQHGVTAHYVGHPLLDALADYPFNAAFRENNQLDQRPIIALLPGSRKQEIAIKLPIMLEATRAWQQSHQLVVAAAPGQTETLYTPYLKSFQATLVSGQTYDLLKNAAAAVVTSGTATLETALLGTPEVVVYRGSPISYQIGKRLVKVKFISLVNLILDRPLLTELIQNDCNPTQIATALRELLEKDKKTALQQEYSHLRTVLGSAGASEKAAEKILSLWA
jgi:lipid-A-disaccharide synthase